MQTLKPRNLVAKDMLTTNKYRQRVVNPKKISKRKFRNQKDAQNYYDLY